MKSYIHQWAWLASNDSALEFIYFLETLGNNISFKDIYQYCDLEEKLQNRYLIQSLDSCDSLAVKYTWKDKSIEDVSLFADAVFVLSLIIINCHHNNGVSDLTEFAGAKKSIKLEYSGDNIDVLISSLTLLEAHIMKNFGFCFYDEDSTEIQESKRDISAIKNELEKIKHELKIY